MRISLVSCLTAVCLAACISANAQQVVLQCNNDPGVWGRGDCALARGHHGQWVRGSVRLLSNGQVQAKVGLETDSTFFGISGNLTFDLLDANNKVVGSGSTDKVHIPGKSPGKARIWESDWKSASVSIPANKISLVKSIRVNAVPLDDNLPNPFGLDTFKVSVSFNFPNG